jgi:hypothetical protein
VTKAVQHHDSTCLAEGLDKLTTLAEILELDIKDSFVTLDPGFDSEGAEEEIEMHDLVPIIKPNPRSTKNESKLHEQFEKFDSIKHIYKERYKVERSFAWEDTYRRLVTRYEKLDVVHEGFKFLAYSMINLRWFIKSK